MTDVQSLLWTPVTVHCAPVRKSEYTNIYTYTPFIILVATTSPTRNSIIGLLYTRPRITLTMEGCESMDVTNGHLDIRGIRAADTNWTTPNKPRRMSLFQAISWEHNNIKYKLQPTWSQIASPFFRTCRYKMRRIVTVNCTIKRMSRSLWKFKTHQQI